jgi:splicing factor 3B subunit 4
MSAAIEQRNQDATCYVGNLDDRINEELLWELMLQVGPVVNVHMPKDKVSGKYLNYGFCEYRTEEDADYAIKVLNMVKLYGRPIKVNKASQDKKIAEVGANVFIGNLDPGVDEKLLYDTFSAFGGISQTPKIMCDPDTGSSKGYGFVSFDSFEASDSAIECMNGQYLANRPIIVQYAFKRDTPGERHGSQAERILAASRPSIKSLRPHTLFGTGNGDTTNLMNNALAGYSQQPDFQYLQYGNPMMMNYGYGMPMPSMPPMPPMSMPMGGMHMPPVPPPPPSAPMPPPLPSQPLPPPPMAAMPPPPPPV